MKIKFKMPAQFNFPDRNNYAITLHRGGVIDAISTPEHRTLIFATPQAAPPSPVRLHPFLDHRRHLRPPFGAIEDAVMPGTLGHVIALLVLGQAGRDLQRGLGLAQP